jgi:hypothetical protein
MQFGMALARSGQQETDEDRSHLLILCPWRALQLNKFMGHDTRETHHERGLSLDAASDIDDDPLMSKVPSSASVPFM